MYQQQAKTTGMALTGSASPAYELREMNDSILAGIGNEDVAQLIRDINAGKKTLADLAKTAPDIAAQLEGKTLITPIMDLLTNQRWYQVSRRKAVHCTENLCIYTGKRHDRCTGASLQYRKPEMGDHHTG